MNEAASRRYEDVEALLFQALGSRGEEGTFLEELDRDHLSMLYLSAENALWTVHWERAARAFAGVLREDPHSPLAAAGLVYLLDPDRISRLAEIVVRRPTLVRPRVYLGVSHLTEDRPEEAVEALEQAVVIAPADSLAWHYLADALFRVGARDRAADAAETLLRLGARSYRIRRSAACLLWRAGKRRRSLRVAFETPRVTPGVRALLLPVTLPLQAGSRGARLLWWTAFFLAVVLLRVASAGEGDLRWWALAAGGLLGAVIVATDVSSEHSAQRARMAAYAAKRKRLRAELQSAGAAW